MNYNTPALDPGPDLPQWMSNILALESFKVVRGRKLVADVVHEELRMYCTICETRMNNMMPPSLFLPEQWAVLLAIRRREHRRQAVCEPWVGERARAMPK